MPTESQTPTLADVLRAAIDSSLDSLYTAMPGKVVSAISSNFTVSVQPSIKQPYTAEDGSTQYAALPVIPNVPVIFPGSGDMRITFPVDVGDTVLILFANCTLDNWKSAAANTITIPSSDRRHLITDAMAIPGLLSLRGATSVNSPNQVVANTMVMTTNNLRLGGVFANDPVVRKSDLQAVVTDINDRFTNHVHSGVTTGAGVSGTGTAAAITTPNCSTVVKSM